MRQFFQSRLVITGLAKSKGLRLFVCLLLAQVALALMGLVPGAPIPALASAQQQTSGASSFRELAQRAGAARDKGDLSSAIQLYRKALAQRPAWQEGWWDYGSVLYDDGQFAAASAALHKLAALNPKLGDAWALIGLSEYETRKYDLALNDLRRARSFGEASDPALADVVDFHLALLLNTRGQPEAANLLLLPLFLRGRRSEDLQVAMGLVFLRIPLLPSQIDPSKDALIHDAGSLAAVLAQREYGEAEAGLRALLEKYPGTSFVHYAWGAMLASQGKDDAAEAQFQQETKLNPDSSLAYAEWAYLEFKANRLPEAMAISQRAVQLSDNSFMAYYVLGASLLASGNAEVSIPPLQRARDIAPESLEIRYSLSRAYAKAGKNDLAKREQAEFLRLKEKQRHLRGEDAPGTFTTSPSTSSPSTSGTDTPAPPANPPSQP
jgi:tetratricopeptide (TPR) repeat protein